MLYRRKNDGKSLFVQGRISAGNIVGEDIARSFPDYFEPVAEGELAQPELVVVEATAPEEAILEALEEVEPRPAPVVERLKPKKKHGK